MGGNDHCAVYGCSNSRNQPERYNRCVSTMLYIYNENYECIDLLLGYVLTYSFPLLLPLYYSALLVSIRFVYIVSVGK